MNGKLIGYRLFHSSPETVYEWLRKANTQPTEEYVCLLLEYDNGLQGFARDLLRRDDPLINLAIALYIDIPDIAYELFRRGDPHLQCAVLSGSTVSCGTNYSCNKCSNLWLVKNEDALDILISDFRKDQLKALLSNPKLRDEIICNLLKRQHPFDSLEDSKWLTLLEYVGSNERLATPFEKNTYWKEHNDLLNDSDYYGLIKTAWKTHEIVPVSLESAKTIKYLLSDLLKSHSLFLFSPDEYNLDLISRWISSNDEEERLFHYIRVYIARTLVTLEDCSKWMLEHDDLAIREAYYREVLNPSIDSVETGYKRDGEIFIECASKNLGYYLFKDTRELFAKYCSRCQYYSYKTECGKRIGSEYVIEDVIESADSTFRFAYYQYVKNPNEKVVIEGYKKDAKDFLCRSRLNDEYFLQPQTREALRCIYQRENIDFKEYEEEYIRARASLIDKYPEWQDDVENKANILELRIAKVNHNKLICNFEHDRPPAHDYGATIKLFSGLSVVAFCVALISLFIVV